MLKALAIGNNRNQKKTHCETLNISLRKPESKDLVLEDVIYKLRRKALAQITLKEERLRNRLKHMAKTPSVSAGEKKTPKPFHVVLRIQMYVFLKDALLSFPIKFHVKSEGKKRAAVQFLYTDMCHKGAFLAWSCD